MFFDDRRYDLAKVGRYKFNKKLGISARLEGNIPAEDIVDPMTGEILAEAGELLNRAKAEKIEAAGVNQVLVKTDENYEHASENTIVIGNNFTFVDAYELDFDMEELGFKEKFIDHFLMNFMKNILKTQKSLRKS